MDDTVETDRPTDRPTDRAYLLKTGQVFVVICDKHPQLRRRTERLWLSMLDALRILGIHNRRRHRG